MIALAAAPDRTWDPVRFQRGTRGFAAFLTTINGLAVLAFGAVVAPLSGVGSPLDAWLAIAGIAAGIAHLVAVYGLVRGREWSGTLVAYLSAAGIGASVFAVLLIARAGESVLGAADASAIGYFIWMIGSWLVAARFAYKAFRAPTTVAPRTSVALPTPRVVPPVTTHRRVISLTAAAA